MWLQQKNFFGHLLPKSCLPLELANTILTCDLFITTSFPQMAVDSPSQLCLEVSLRAFRTVCKVQLSLHLSVCCALVQEEPRSLECKGA